MHCLIVPHFLAPSYRARHVLFPSLGPAALRGFAPDPRRHGGGIMPNEKRRRPTTINSFEGIYAYFGMLPLGLAILVVLRSLSDIAINGRGPAVVE